MEPGQVYRGLGHELVREAGKIHRMFRPLLFTVDCWISCLPITVDFFVRFTAMNLIGRVSSAELPLHGNYALLSKWRHWRTWKLEKPKNLFLPFKGNVFSDQILRLVEVNLLVENVKIQVLSNISFVFSSATSFLCVDFSFWLNSLSFLQEMAVETLASFLKTYGASAELDDASTTARQMVTIQERCFHTLLANLVSPSDVVR